MMNLLWRGTFAEYLLQMWNPHDENYEPLLSTSRRCTRCGVMPPPTCGRPARCRCCACAKQPYGLLPLVGKRYQSARTTLPVETALGKVLGVLRPMWELASAAVPRLVDGDVDRAKSILQTAAWSQTAYYRDKDVNMCLAAVAVHRAQDRRRSRPGRPERAVGAGTVAELASAHRRLQRLPARPAVFRRLPRRRAVGAGRCAGPDERSRAGHHVCQRQELPGGHRRRLGAVARVRARHARTRHRMVPKLLQRVGRLLGAEGAGRRRRRLPRRQRRGDNGELTCD